MKLFEIAQPTHNMLKHLVGELEEYQKLGDEEGWGTSANLHKIYYSAMRYFPQHHYTGPMFRGWILPESVDKTSQQAIRKWLRQLSSHKQVFSWTTNSKWFDDPGAYLYGDFHIITQQNSTGLNVFQFLEAEYPKYFEKEWYNAYDEEQEVYAPLSKHYQLIVPSYRQ